MKTIHQLNHQWNEIVFENRNKAYGAYNLRETYEERVKRALLLAFAFITILVAGPLVISRYFTKVVEAHPERGIIFDQILVKDDVVKVKPQEQQKKQENKSSRDNTTSLARRDTDNTPDDTALTLLAMNTSGTGTSSTTDEDIPSAPPSGGTIPLGASDIHSSWQVDKMPEFPGGQEAFYTFMRNNLRYPGPAREEGVEGTVYVSFVINAEGTVTHIKLLRGMGYGLDEAALQVIGKMPGWKPGMAHGEAVNTAMQLPIKFVIVK